MTARPAGRVVDPDDPVAVELYLAVRGGDVGAVAALLRADAGVADVRVRGRGGGSRSALHLVTDWPGYFPRGPEIARLLLEAGADPDAGGEPETPLHWAASSDDVDVAEVLVEGGARLDIPGGSIGTPIENAVGYSCWHVAHLLAERGAPIEPAWVAAALGRLGLLAEILGERPEQETVDQAFWHACAAGRRRAAEYLLGRGADWAWVPDYARGTALDAAAGRGTMRANVIDWLTEAGAPTEDQRGGPGGGG